MADDSTTNSSHPSKGPVEPRQREFLNLQEASALVRLSVWTLRHLIRKGELSCIRVGRRVLLARNELLKFMERHTERAAKGPYPSIERR